MFGTEKEKSSGSEDLGRRSKVLSYLSLSLIYCLAAEKLDEKQHNENFTICTISEFWTLYSFE